MISIYLPISEQNKALNYHYQSHDQHLFNLVFLGTLFRTLPYFRKVYVSEKTKLINQLSNPSQIIVSKPKNENYHTITISSQTNHKADLISSTSFNQSLEKANIISITGDGKGKTTIGLGFLLFNYLKGLKVTSYHFFKDRNFSSGVSEFNFPNFLKSNFIMHSQNSGFLLPNASQEEIEKHRQSAQDFLVKIRKDIDNKKYNFIFLDEIIDALISDLINQSQIEEIIKLARQNKVNLILTGRYIQSEKFDISKFFDSNILVKKIKHPYDSGLQAVKGLDY